MHQKIYLTMGFRIKWRQMYHNKHKTDRCYLSTNILSFFSFNLSKYLLFFMNFWWNPWEKCQKSKNEIWFLIYFRLNNSLLAFLKVVSYIVEISKNDVEFLSKKWFVVQDFSKVINKYFVGEVQSNNLYLMLLLFSLFLCMSVYFSMISYC